MCITFVIQAVTTCITIVIHCITNVILNTNHLIFKTFLCITIVIQCITNVIRSKKSIYLNNACITKFVRIKPLKISFI